jgi:hypothetical protein
MDIVLDRKTFIYALTCSHGFSSSSPLSMVYEFLQDYFVLNDFISGFNFFWNMWAYRSWSCSSINIMHACCIATIGFGGNKLKVFDPS